MPPTGTTGSVFPPDSDSASGGTTADGPGTRPAAKPFDQTNGLIDATGDSDGTATSDTTSAAEREAGIDSEQGHVPPVWRKRRTALTTGRTHGITSYLNLQEGMSMLRKSIRAGLGLMLLGAALSPVAPAVASVETYASGTASHELRLSGVPVSVPSGDVAVTVAQQSC